jgi:hypothetical protein
MSAGAALVHQIVPPRGYPQGNRVIWKKGAPQDGSPDRNSGAPCESSATRPEGAVVKRRECHESRNQCGLACEQGCYTGTGLEANPRILQAVEPRCAFARFLVVVRKFSGKSPGAASSVRFFEPPLDTAWARPCR